jgi:hypothetical protein
MTLTIKPVLTAYVQQTWDMVKDFLDNGLEWGDDDYTLEQARLFLSRGDWLLIVAVDEQTKVHGATAVNFINMPNDRIAYVITMGGKLISNQATYEQFAQILKGYGATKVQGAARESVARLWTRFGYKERYRIVEAKL